MREYDNTPCDAPLCNAQGPNGERCTYDNRLNGKPHKGNHSWYVRPEPVPPTIDEMLESIATKLSSDVEQIMLECSANEGWLHDMYSLSQRKGLSIRPNWRQS